MSRLSTLRVGIVGPLWLRSILLSPYLTAGIQQLTVRIAMGFSVLLKAGMRLRLASPLHGPHQFGKGHVLFRFNAYLHYLASDTDKHICERCPYHLQFRVLQPR